MAGPFPGMDPYLETPATWPDVHQGLITYIRDALQPQLRPHYQARIGERVYVVEKPQERNYYPDLSILRRPPRQARERAETPVAVAEPESPSAPQPAEVEPAEQAAAPRAEPRELTLPSGEYREPYLEILHVGGQVVTVIEVLSPANKTPGEGRERYFRKRREVLGSQAHLIEIDLLSQGIPLVQAALDDPERQAPWRYVVIVHRFPARDRLTYFPIYLSNRLPVLPIPLREPDPDVAVDLQAVLDRCYDNGSYADFLDYTRPPAVPVTPEEWFWMQTVVKKMRPVDT